MIIIEGPDNAGKSTLAEKLSKALNIPVIHSVRPEKGWKEKDVLYHSTWQLRPQEAILDRVYAISEYVYGRVIRGKTALGELHSEALFDLYNRPYLIIYCRPDDNVILDNKGRDQMDGVIQHHQTIIDEYDVLMEEIKRFSIGSVIHYDWKSTIFDNLVAKCNKHLTDFHSRNISSQFMTKFRDKQFNQESGLNKVDPLTWNQSKHSGGK